MVRAFTKQSREGDWLVYQICKSKKYDIQIKVMRKMLAKKAINKLCIGEWIEKAANVEECKLINVERYMQI